MGEGLRKDVEPDDVLQETFLRAFRAIGRFEWQGETVRIDCGGGARTGPKGTAWGGDRFFLGGSPAEGQQAIAKTDDPGLYRSARSFPSDECGPAGYRVPLPKGRYRVTLHFAERYLHTVGRRRFDIALEGKTVRVGHEPLAAGLATAEKMVLGAQVLDGALEIGFTRREGVPTVSGIEVGRLE